MLVLNVWQNKGVIFYSCSMLKVVKMMSFPRHLFIFFLLNVGIMFLHYTFQTRHNVLFKY